MCHDVTRVRPPTSLLITCEHAGRDVPEAYRHLFVNAAHVLDSHRGYDIGAPGVALRLASRCSALLIFATTTRLLVECNRSPGHHERFSEFTDKLSAKDKRKILAA